jgi:hypothetical protein
MGMEERRGRTKDRGRRRKAAIPPPCEKVKRTGLSNGPYGQAQVRVRGKRMHHLLAWLRLFFEAQLRSTRSLTCNRRCWFESDYIISEMTRRTFAVAL